MKKVLLIDRFTHTFLKEELKNHRIELIVQSEIENISESFDAVIFVIEEKKEIFKLSKNINMFSNNILVMVNDVDNSFLRYCQSIGVKDVIKTPYNPVYTAKRIENLISDNNIDKEEKHEDCIQKVLRRYAKKAYIRKESIGFVACKFLKSYDKYIYHSDVLKVIKENLRDIDYIGTYNGIIIMILPNMKDNQINCVIERIREKINCCKLFFTYSRKKRINLFDVLSNNMNFIKKLEIFLQKGIIADRELVAQDIIQNQLYNLYSRVI